jgi:serine/threonine protein kinase
MTQQPAATALLQAALRRRLISVKEAMALRHVLVGCDDDPQALRQRLGHGPGQISAGTTRDLIALLPAAELPDIAPYRRLALLGRGRLATSWLGLGQVGLVVIKEPIPALLTRPDELVADVQALLGGGQRYLVPYLAVTRTTGGVALVQHYRQGRDTTQRAEIKGEASEARALTVLRQAAKGLAQLHHERRCHGHLHPGNILLDGEGHAALTDYGLALRPGEALPRPGWDAAALGRQAWAAPEELTATPVPGPAADIYALGCIGYWLLAGVPPFPGSPERQALQHAGAPRPDVRELAPGVSELTAKTILKCMQSDPAERYRDARALVHSLERDLAELEHLRPDTEPVAKRADDSGPSSLILNDPE